jgi:hypothetical protein
MKIPMKRTRRAARRAGAPALALTLVLAACGLDQVTIPPLEGPSELALSLRLTVDPDVLTADGLSTAWVEAIVHNQNGERWQGKEILFALADEDGYFADIGKLFNPMGPRVEDYRLHAGTATVSTDGEGVARVIYQSPMRPGASANQTAIITARPVGLDANAALNRTVRIELKSAEPRIFPQVPGNTDPVCGFTAVAPMSGQTCAGGVGGTPPTCTINVNTLVQFHSTSSDADGVIVRYQWYFGDATPMEDAPDVDHIYRTGGTFTTTHIVTDDDGSVAACSGSVTVQ